MSYSWLREDSREAMPVTQGDLQKLEDYADRLFSRVGIDVAFTRHFLDRVNDERNQKQITVGELIRIFKQEYKYYGKKIAQLGPDAEAVMKDMKTDVNIPFALQWDNKNNELDLIAKTVMRKKDFKTPDPEFAVADVQPDEIKVGPNIFEDLAPNSEIYVDMDGVLADFFGEWAKLMGVSSWRQIQNIDAALDKVREQPDFWSNLPMTSNAKTLLNAIKKFKGKYNILSAPLPNDPKSEPGKQEWIKKNLASFPPQKVILDHNKAKYAKQPDGTPNALIDDYGENIKKWEAAGGVGIKHTDVAVQGTIKQLDAEISEDFVDDLRRGLNRRLNSGMYKKAADAFHEYLGKLEKPYRHSLGFYAMEFARKYLKVDWKNLKNTYLDLYGDNVLVKEDIVEAWSKQYKDSINCSNPKGFSQKAHCAGKKKKANEDVDLNTQRGRLEYYMNEPIGNDMALHLGKLPKYFDGTDPLADMVPDRVGKFALHPDNWEGTYYSLTNKDTAKIKFYKPQLVKIPANSVVGDMAIANRYYRTKDEDEKKVLAVAYRDSMVPYGADTSHIKMPEIIMPESIEEGKRIPRKKGQPAGSKKHSDLYTDENPKGTIHGLKFATVKDAEASVNKIKNSGKKHAHKIQAAVAMEQRAKAAGKKSAAAVYRKYINAMKKKTKKEEIEENLDNCKYGKYYCSTDKKWKCRKGPKQTREEYSFVREGVGIITKQNTTADVKPGETQRQAKKLGMNIDSKGSPPLLHKKAAKNSDPNTLTNLGIGS